MMTTALSSIAPLHAEERISLAGKWEFALDPSGRGISERWFLSPLPDSIQLPGSTDAQGKGTKSTVARMDRLTREYEYVGPAWYRKEVAIPESWADKQATLFFERCHWETQVWVDGEAMGMRNSLSTPHIYDLTGKLAPGKHILTICVDNMLKINVSHSYGNMNGAHSVTDETQTNWNGIIGRLELVARDPVWIESIRIFPDAENRKIEARLTIGNATGREAQANVRLRSVSGEETSPGVDFVAKGNRTEVVTTLSLDSATPRWDEFAPSLLEVEAVIQAADGPNEYADTARVHYGLRDLRAQGDHFTLNGRKIFLRGNLECCIFPRTGYPPMTPEDWRRLMNIAQSHGLNHLRFHSWCPPDAAFVAADEVGFMLQIEAPFWDAYGRIGYDPARAKWMLDEVGRIVDAYGNHPSFCLMSMGNELGDGKDLFLQYLVGYLRDKDPRHLYCCASCPPIATRNDDYFVGAGTEKGITRGLGAFENGNPSTLHDFRAALTDFNRPYVSHEVGRLAVYPNYSEIVKYTGHLKPLNLESFRASLESHGMIDQADDFQRASGSLAVIIYKESIEALLRTPNSAGFQLLGIQDFPGQGTALIGILDAFWDSKGLIAPEDFRRFCGPTVPLLRMRNFVWTTGEAFRAHAEIAHYGPADLMPLRMRWRIANAKDATVAEGVFDPVAITTGSTTDIGDFDVDLAQIHAPARLTVQLAIEGTDISNAWNIWVYPEKVDTTAPGDNLVADAWTTDTKTALTQGRKVLLLPKPGSLLHVLEARWLPIDWSLQLLAGLPPTMGILCDPKHPALAQFPTDFHADWQWVDPLDQSFAIDLDATPADYRPIVQFVPDINLNKKLGAVWEVRVGKGRLLVCSIDIASNIVSRPAARQLRHSLMAYMTSKAFKPKHNLEPELLDTILTPALHNENIIDGPPDTATAVLHVRAASNAKLMVAAPWEESADLVVRKAEGFGYTVKGNTWHEVGHWDEGGFVESGLSSWFDWHLVVTVTCPKEFEGTFYAHFHDWNDRGLDTTPFFDGRDLGPLGRYRGSGVWLKLPVGAAESADGQLVLDARATRGPNVMVTQVVLIPKNP